MSRRSRSSQPDVFPTIVLMKSESPVATILDPLTWSYDWSYEIERSILAEHGVKLIVPEDEEHRDTLVARADVVVSSSLVHIDSRLIASFKRCVGIVCYSSGMDQVDAEAARRAGIAVTNVQANTMEVAEHAMALLLALRRRLVPMAAAADSGEWDLRLFPEIWDIPRLHGQTVGIIGAGRVGREVAQRARAFGMRTVAHYHLRPAAADPLLPHLELQDLMAASDNVVVCASLNPDSLRMINRQTLSAVKPGAVLVNIARGSLVDEEALLDALNSGRLAGAALDVRDPEPPDGSDPLSGRSDVIQTPHMAGASAGALDDLHRLAARQVIHLLKEAGRL